MDFVEFTTSGVLPTGDRTALPLLAEQEERLLLLPSDAWAPESPGLSSQSTLDQIMALIDGPEGSNRACRVGHNIYALKRRLWEGHPPTSTATMRVSQTRHSIGIDSAIEQITAVATVFEYLNLPPVSTNMRSTFNLIADHLEAAERHINALRANQGQPPSLNLVGLWEEFIRTKFQVMVGRAHAWAIDHVDFLRQRLTALAGKTSTDPTAPENKALRTQFSALIDLGAMVDKSVWLCMEGYRGYQSPSPHDPPLPGLHTPLSMIRMRGYQDLLVRMTKPGIMKALKATPGENSREKFHHLPYRTARLNITISCQNDIRRQMRGPPKDCGVDLWVQRILKIADDVRWKIPKEEQKKHGFGLVIYRLGSYDASDKLWLELKRRVNASLAYWGEGVRRVADIKPWLHVHWIDGKALGIAENDIEAAKRHFRKVAERNPFRINTDVFLALDTFSLDSFGERPSPPGGGMSEGDFRSHILAVDAHFNPAAPPEEYAHKSPGFDGTMRILTRLVWNDLYAMLTLKSATLADLWPLAMDHPWKVYTGNPVPRKLALWRRHNRMQATILGPLVEAQRKENPELAAKLEKIFLPNKR
ncbi:hypothetical protein BO71DRAFT_336994 [Aspergillus ellipticus CBS 707.79]|uniref:Uncharacterized protein n=1 Tax=Aspergillus ellipticus CBS 707.79 TaxID=1448320 RepID=A0A319D480_9EURO|nr:hypothetical protein BO71DRAFT_336994 [Aspergillus ellipticus CBS 707.79]